MAKLGLLQRKWVLTVDVLIPILFLLPNLVSADQTLLLCSRYSINGQLSPAFSKAEVALICGTPPSSAGALDQSKAWTIVPSAQAILYITAFLQARGYLKPKIESRGNAFDIDPGPLVRLSRITLEGAPVKADLPDMTQQSGKILTPELMTQLEQSVQSQLASQGFPCASVHAEGNSDDGSVTLHIRAGAVQRIGQVEYGKIPGIVDNILSRYDAFKVGDFYDDRLSAISSDRAISSGVVEDAYFIPHCREGQTVDLVEYVRAGSPRIFSLGFNLNTEEIGRVSSSVRNARVGSTASNVELQINGTSKVQDLSAYYQDYFLKMPSRQWLRPLIRVLHENENPFEIWHEGIEMIYGTSWDVKNLSGQITVGPEFGTYQTLQGLGPRNSHALLFTAETRLVSHEFEFNHSATRGGAQLSARAEVSNSVLGSQFSGRRLVLEGEKFWSFGRAQTSSAVLIRTRAGGNTTGFSGESPNVLPPQFRQYLGGQSDLRGFGRMELPGNRVGGLSSWFGNLEVRPHFWGERLEPMAFVDAGEFGDHSFSIQSPLYWSPGLGVNWISGFGNVQATLAHGYVRGGTAGSLSHVQFYLSVGGSL